MAVAASLRVIHTHTHIYIYAFASAFLLHLTYLFIRAGRVGSAVAAIEACPGHYVPTDGTDPLAAPHLARVARA